jgi:hypothetical protein
VLAAFLGAHATRPLNEAETSRALGLLELQRHAMLMYTSCGWFFDELSGIETVQVIQYAGRVVQLGFQLLGEALEPEFLSRLEQARSNIPEHQNGRNIFEKFVKPALVDLPRVAAHYAISSLFEDYERDARVFSFDATRHDQSVSTSGRVKLAVGRARLTSRITHQSAEFAYGVLHMGDHVLNAGVRPFSGEDAYAQLAAAAREAFDRADYPAVIRTMDGAFGGTGYTLASLFRDEQHAVVRRVLEPVLAEVDASYRQVYDNHASLIRFLARMNMTIPRRLRTAAQFVLNGELQRLVAESPVRPERIRQLLEEARSQSVTLDDVTIGHAMRRSLEAVAYRLRDRPEHIEALRALHTLVAVARELPFYVELSRVQNVVFELASASVPGAREHAAPGGAAAEEWLTVFRDLAARLKLRVAG